MSKILVGYGYTNNKGIATLDYDAEGNQLQTSGYTGTGAGDIDFIAQYHDGTNEFLSGRCHITDAIQVNNTTVNSDEFYTGSATRTVVGNGIKFEGLGYALLNKVGTTKDYWGNSADWDCPLCFEADVISGNDVYALADVDQQGNSIDWGIQAPCTVKMTMKDGVAKLYFDDDLKKTTTYIETGNKVRIGFRLNSAESSIIVNNVRLYPI